MAIDLQAIERLATDQPSLKAAAGLAKPGKWSGIGASHDGHLIWGECAGSGANPYRVMADLRDLGNKCTCPSRKFPCKHVLALLWLRAEAVVPFGAADTPDWVSDWLGRRRTGAVAAKPATPGALAAAKDVRAALAVEPEAPEDPKAAARREAASAKRAEDTERAILDALDALEQWIGDQLRLGLGAFVDDATVRCRRIGARLVDGKAAMLAGRVDELPARLLALPSGDRARGAVVELGKLVLLARAFRASPRDTDIRRAVASAESREAVLVDPEALRLTATWEVLAEQVQTRRDGLVSQTTWLLNLGATGPRFAMLLDFFPASAGKRGSVFTPGEQFSGELVFYPGRLPLRALLINRSAVEAPAPEWPVPEAALAYTLSAPLLAEPWTIDVPVLLPGGRVAVDGTGRAWWRATEGDIVLPMAGEAEGLIRGTDLTRAAAIWSGGRLEILAAQTPWGRIGAHG
ncbi:MAG: SWIM zinc finger family protein [Sphingomonas sp.]|uniref:SWIM zinc finger family protein n=1 Tax=Sphingomonas sp. TaxID=28214 RepID=UPI003564C972